MLYDGYSLDNLLATLPLNEHMSGEIHATCDRCGTYVLLYVDKGRITGTTPKEFEAAEREALAPLRAISAGVTLEESAADVPGTQAPDRDSEANRLVSQLREERAELLLQQVAVLEATFPEAVADARRFVAGTHALPWEFAVAFVGDEYRAIQEKYEVQPSRHRPELASVLPLTNVFFDACELLHEQGVSGDRKPELL
jgi:hypothetical protein